MLSPSFRQFGVVLQQRSNTIIFKSFGTASVSRNLGGIYRLFTGISWDCGFAHRPCRSALVRDLRRIKCPGRCRRRGSAVGGWPETTASVPGGKGGGGVVLLPPRPYYTIQTFYIANIEHNMLGFIFSLPGFLAISSTFLGILLCSHAGRTLGRRIAASGSLQSAGCRCT